MEMQIANFRVPGVIHGDAAWETFTSHCNRPKQAGTVYEARGKCK